jgi:hypothetical protein
MVKNTRKFGTVNVLKPQSGVEFVTTGIRPFAGKNGTRLLKMLRQIPTRREWKKKLWEAISRRHT